MAGSNYEVNIQLNVRKINQQLSNLERRIKKLNEIAMGQRGAGKTVLKTERDKLATATRTLRREQQITKEKQKQSRIENQTVRSINARNTSRSSTTATAGKSKTTGGGGGGIVSGALISGAFPLLFGQGPLGAAAGFGGGLLGGAIGGQTGGFAGGLVATALLTMITEAVEFRKQIEKVNVTIEKTGGTSRLTASQIKTLAKNMKVTKEEALQAANAFAAFGAQSSLVLAETFKDRSSFKVFSELDRDARTFISTVEKLFDENELGIEQAKESLSILQKKGVAEASIFVKSLKFQEKVREEIAKQVPTQEDVNAAQRVYLSNFDRFGTPLQNYMLLNEEQRKEINLLITNEGQMRKRIGTEEERFNKKMKIIKDELAAQKELTKELERQAIIQAPVDELNRLIEPLTQIDALSKNMGSSFADSFKGIIRGSMTAQEALRNLFQRTADHFIDMAAQILAAQVRAGIMGIFSNMFGGGTGNVGMKILGAGQPSLQALTPFGTAGQFVGKSSAIGFAADGGRIPGGRPTVVGERGPELFTPGVSGMITPNHALGGSTSIVVNVDASGSSVEGDEQQGRELGRVISAAVQSEILQQKRPGGLLA